MTMNHIFSKLRKSNKNHYTQLIFCICFAVFLITSFAATLYSPTVQLVLPIGGDSRKQVSMIFAIALIGCLFFGIYAAGLFFKYKSKETGVFLALGTPKKILAKALYVEMVKTLLSCILVGLILGSIASIGIWQLFRLLLVDTSQMRYQFSPIGLLIGLGFGLVIAFCVLVMAKSFMKRSNLMDILNEGRKNEKIIEVTKWYGYSGAILLATGILLGYVVPMIAANNFNFLIPDVWNAVYILAVLGIYRLITFIISYHKKGHNPSKYYKNIIPFSMMKATGKQTVRNMLVISLLIAGSLFALFYVPMNFLPHAIANAKNPVDFAFHYKLSADEVNKEEIYELAEQYDETITDYNELILSKLIGSGVNRDWTDSGEFIEEYQEKYMFFEFIRVSDFNQATGKYLDVIDESYFLITQPDTTEGFWTKYDDLTIVTNAETNQSIPLAYAGTVDCAELMNGRQNRYVISDADFEGISQNIAVNHQTKQILFNVSDVKSSYPFSKALYEEFLRHAPSDMAHMANYDEYQEEQAISNGKAYSYAEPMVLKSDNPDLMNHWPYYPSFRVLTEKTFLQNNAIFILLFIYVSIICLAAVGIIAYTRSITIGLNNKNLFEYLKKLGANNKYIKKCITSQLTKIYVAPAVIGSILMLGFMLLILGGNDSFFSSSERVIFLVDLVITLVVSLYLYVVYRASLKKIRTIVEI